MFSTGDTTAADGVFAVSYVDHQKPLWVQHEGPAEFRVIVELARRTLPGLTVRVADTVIGDGDTVAARLVWVSDCGVRETLEMLRVEDGKVAEHWGAEV